MLASLRWLSRHGGPPSWRNARLAPRAADPVRCAGLQPGHTALAAAPTTAAPTSAPVRP